MKSIKLPTGFLFTNDYEKGKLETLSIGDYGKDKNIKADFLGYSREINGVANGSIKPLQDKWVITLSTQYGCKMKCNFCDVPSVNFKGNASLNDLRNQLFLAIKCFPDIRYTDRLNIHFARMGEPLLNNNVFLFADWLGGCKEELIEVLGLRIEVIHPVLTTMCPKILSLDSMLIKWANVKNDFYNGQAGLQLSINSTCDKQRDEMFNNCSTSLKGISKAAKRLPNPLGRKYCLNFAYASGYEVDGKKLANLFNPDHFMVKITPIHNNNACKTNNIKTIDGYENYSAYKEPEKSLKDAGFDTLVFIPSQDEEDGCITCGNAILGGSKIKLK